MNDVLNEITVSQRLAHWALAVKPSDLPPALLEKMRDILVDVVGLCIAARNQDYVLAAKAAAEPGDHILIGHGEKVSASSASLINGTAAHGEDFDDTFEGGPVHSGAVLIPALFAASQSQGLTNDRVVLGLAVGAEVLCRLALTLPKAVHKAGFHPTAVLGVFGATIGICAACGYDEKVTADALGIAGSMASGIIEYLGDGSWTKRMHPGWAAQSAIRACNMAKAGFVGPKAVFEGKNGVFKTFAPSIEARRDQLFEQLGSRWVAETIAFKPYPCGGMIQPYIDCAVRLRERGVSLDGIDRIICKTAEGIVHRLWEPLDLKQTPPSPFAAKFSTPFCLALGLVRGHARLDDFSEATIKDEDLLRVAALVDFEIDPDNPYPYVFTGHVRIEYTGGRVEEIEQGFVRGGAEHPLTRQEIDDKFRANMGFGKYADGDGLIGVCEKISQGVGDFTLYRELT